MSAVLRYDAIHLRQSHTSTPAAGLADRDQWENGTVPGQLTRARIRPLSNAKSIPMADAQNGNVVHNMSTVSGGGRVMSQKQNSQTPKKTNYLALGVASKRMVERYR